MNGSDEITERLVTGGKRRNQIYAEDVKPIYYSNQPNRSDSYDDKLKKEYQVKNKGIILPDQNTLEEIEESSNQNLTEICLICQEVLYSNNLVKLDCDHKYCYKCICEYLITDLKATCPHLTCQSQISEKLIESLLSRQDYQKFLDFKHFDQLISNESLMWCPVPDCKGYDIKGDTTKLKCNECSFLYCSKCSHAWHENKNCDLNEASIVQLYMDIYDLNLCPRCKIVIDLNNTECPIVKCTKCKYVFCKCCGCGGKCLANRNGKVLRLFDIFYWSLLIPLIPFHTFIFVFLNLKYIKIGFIGTTKMKDFTKRHPIISYFLAFFIALLLIPAYLLFLPNVMINLNAFPFVIISQCPKRNESLISSFFYWLLGIGSFIFYYCLLNTFGLLLLPYRIWSLFFYYCFSKKPEYGRYGLKSRFHISDSFLTRKSII